VHVGLYKLISTHNCFFKTKLYKLYDKITNEIQFIFVKVDLVGMDIFYLHYWLKNAGVKLTNTYGLYRF